MFCNKEDNVGKSHLNIFPNIFVHCFQKCIPGISTRSLSSINRTDSVFTALRRRKSKFIPGLKFIHSTYTNNYYFIPYQKNIRGVGSGVWRLSDPWEGHSLPRSMLLKSNLKSNGKIFWREVMVDRSWMWTYFNYPPFQILLIQLDQTVRAG